MDGIDPKLDREQYEREMREAFERVLAEVSDAVDNAPAGKVIRGSEEAARDALDRFRVIAYEKAVQLRADAAEAAFPPSDERNDESPNAS